MLLRTVSRKTQTQILLQYYLIDDAQKLGTSYFGIGDGKLSFTSYRFVEGDDSYVMSVATDDCTPLYLQVTSGIGKERNYLLFFLFSIYFLFYGVVERYGFDPLL